MPYMTHEELMQETEVAEALRTDAARMDGMLRRRSAELALLRYAAGRLITIFDSGEPLDSAIDSLRELLA
jgi:hypothetical protein